MYSAEEQEQLAFGVRVANRRAELKMSQDALANLTGVTKNTIHLIESGKRDVRMSTVRLLADGLKCKVSYLMGEDESSDDPALRDLAALLQSLPESKRQIILANANSLATQLASI